MYDELVKALRETDFGDVCVLCESELCRGKDCVIIQDADAIEELSLKYIEERNAAVELTGELASKPRWIPVTERLPEPETDVLSFRIYGSFSQMSEVTINDMKKNGEWCYEGVTHWMQLPEPPKEE